MGKPSKQAPSPPGDSGDAVSLHSNIAYQDRSVGPAGAAGSSSHYRGRVHPLDDDDDDDVPQLGAEDDDLPPMYTDVAESNALLTPHQVPPPAAATYDLGNMVPTFSVDQNTGNETYIAPSLDASPELLERHVESWAQMPPRLYVQVRGTHRELVEEHGKKERRDVVDFDVRVELTPYLYKNVTTRESWSDIRTVENSEKARRGTVFARRAPGAASRDLALDNSPKPSLREWIHRYCAGSSSGLKAFVLQRRVVGLDRERLRDQLIHVVRSTNYRGNVAVYFPCHNSTVSVYNSCRTNHWRSTKWIAVVCYITLTFLLTWPYLFFRTKRFETVFAEWPFSRLDDSGRKEYVSLSEDQLFGLWGQAILTAVLSKRQCTLDQQDLANAHSRTGPPTTGNTAVDAGLDVFMAGIRAMNEVNRQMGWGFDR